MDESTAGEVAPVNPWVYAVGGALFAVLMALSGRYGSSATRCTSWIVPGICRPATWTSRASRRCWPGCH
jgi:hypothetical protein